MGDEGMADMGGLNPRPVRKGLTVVGERIIKSCAAWPACRWR